MPLSYKLRSETVKVSPTHTTTAAATIKSIIEEATTTTYSRRGGSDDGVSWEVKVFHYMKKQKKRTRKWKTFAMLRILFKWLHIAIQCLVYTPQEPNDVKRRRKKLIRQKFIVISRSSSPTTATLSNQFSYHYFFQFNFPQRHSFSMPLDLSPSSSYEFMK